MKVSVETIKSISRLLWILAGFLALFFFDTFYWKFQVFGDFEAPVLTTTSFIRSLILFSLTGFLLWMLQRKQKPEISFDHNKSLDYEKWITICVIAGTLFILFLFVFFPHLFSNLTYEDSYIENTSFLLLFLGACIFGGLFFRYSKKLDSDRLTKYSLALLSLVLFVIAMEEVSWFQRQLKIDAQSIELFEKNEQKEMNFHNFASVAFEFIYYSGTYLFFAFLPFIYLVTPFLSKYKYLSIFIPRSYLIIIGAITSAFNYEKWDSFLTQWAFFSSIWILILLLRRKSIKIDTQIILGGTLILIVTAQLLYLLNGTRFARYWEVTEYKEFYIAILLFLYSIGVIANLSAKIKNPGISTPGFQELKKMR